MRSFIKEIKILKAVLYHRNILQDAITRFDPPIEEYANVKAYRYNLIGFVLSNHQKLHFIAKDILPKFKETSDEIILLEIVIGSLILKKKPREEIRQSFLYTVEKKVMKINAEALFRKICKIDIVNYFDKSDVRNRLNETESIALSLEIPQCIVADAFDTYSYDVAMSVLHSIRNVEYPIYIYNPRCGDEYTLLSDEEFDHFSLGGTLCYRPINEKVEEKCEALNLLDIDLITQMAMSNLDMNKQDIKVAICGCSTSSDIVPILYNTANCKKRSIDAMFIYPDSYEKFYDKIVKDSIDGLTIYYCQRNCIKTTIENNSYDFVFSHAYGNSTGCCYEAIEILPQISSKNMNEIVPSIEDQFQDDSLLVKKGGTLVYLSNSITKYECRNVVDNFLHSHSNYSLQKDGYILKDDYLSYGGYYAALKRSENE